MTDDQPDRSQIWNLLNYKILHATASLMYLLQGMELVRGRILPAYNRYPPNIRHGAVCPPELSYVDVPLVDNGPGFDLSDVLGREGEAEQLAFKAWVEETYNIVWESDLRNAIKASFAANDAIRPRADPLGDLRLIRNDLVHGAGIASAQRTGKCTVLRWFEPGDPMILTMGHVLDFLNHMSLMNLMGGFMSGAAASWFVYPQMRRALEGTGNPRNRLAAHRVHRSGRRRHQRPRHLYCLRQRSLGEHSHQASCQRHADTGPHGIHGTNPR